MADISHYKFTFQELAAILVREQGIREGNWCLSFKFGIQAANMAFNSPNQTPTAIVPLLEIGLQKMDQPSNLTVDASQIKPVNAPKPNKPKKA